MNFVDLHAAISSIGWSLIHFLWQGTLITLTYWIITRSIQSIHVKYWTGMSLVVISLLVPLTNSIQISAQQNTSEYLMLSHSVTPAFQQINTEHLLLYLVESGLPYFVMLWGLTVLFLSFRLIKSWIKLAAIKHDCQPDDSRKLKQIVKNIAIKLDLPSIPMLKVSQAVLVPAAYGLFKPTVLLPLSLISQIPQNQLEAIIKHELCHLKRNDFVHNIIQLCADILLFFHPGIRWMNNDIRHIREQCCDQMVLTHETEAITYARALTNIASYTSGLDMKHSVHLGINDGMLLNRVKILLHNKSNQSSLMIFLPLLMMIAFMFMVLQPAQNQEVNAIGSEDSLFSNNPSPVISEQKSPHSLKKSMGLYPFYPSLNQSRVQTPATPLLSEPTAMDNNSISHTINDISNELTIHSAQAIPEREELMLMNTAITTPAIDLANDLSFAPVVTNTLNMTSAASVETKPANGGSTQVLSSFSGHNSIMPKFKRYLDPVYPQNFWFNQIEQDVIATFKIRANGKAYDISVSSQKNDYVAFEQEVVKAIKKWKFDPDSLNNSTLQRTYQQMFSFAISEEVQKNCKLSQTGSRLKKPMPCNK
ncbi:TonB family protein [Marinicella sediminis]|uniref:TonB family protein n=1 Tax=Marinicella sediminis TaxID=1792834 RepID=A0ABV7J9U0_9GAMM|nr:M56 family metallopeptidase [Marinicella sediminis]